MSNPQPTAAPITPEEIAALRDALAKATQGEWTVEFESSDQTMCGKDMATVYSGRSDRFHGLNLLGRLFDLGPQGERDLSAAVAAHNLAPKLLAALDAAEVRAKVAEFDRMAFEKLSDTTMKAAEISSRAKDAAEAKAVEFAWELFNRNTEFVYVVTSALPRLRALTLASESAAEYLAARGLLRKTGEWTWQRVDRKEGGSK